MTSGSSKVSQLQNEISREAMLKANYYKAVHAHSDIFWMTGKELSGVPGSIATRWISKPADSGNPRRYGLSRQNVNFKQVAGYVSDHDVRKKLVTWEQDTCKDLAQSFKEMVVSRATIARLAGFKSYFHCRSQSKMMTTRSVELFLKDLKSRLDPPLSAFMEQIFEQKAKDLKPDFSIRELRNSLKYYGNTIRDFQNSHPATQINWGDVTCTYILGFLLPSLNRTRCCTIKVFFRDCLPRFDAFKFFLSESHELVHIQKSFSRHVSRVVVHYGAFSPVVLASSSTEDE